MNDDIFDSRVCFQWLNPEWREAYVGAQPYSVITNLLRITVDGRAVWYGDASDTILEHARWCALQEQSLWDCPDVVGRWLQTGDEACLPLAKIQAEGRYEEMTAQRRRINGATPRYRYEAEEGRKTLLVELERFPLPQDSRAALLKDLDEPGSLWDPTYGPIPHWRSAIAAAERMAASAMWTCRAFSSGSWREARDAFNPSHANASDYEANHRLASHLLLQALPKHLRERFDLEEPGADKVMLDAVLRYAPRSEPAGGLFQENAFLGWTVKSRANAPKQMVEVAPEGLVYAKGAHGHVWKQAP